MTTLTISSKGWITIPVDLRKKYALNPGKQVHLVDYGGILAILPVSSDPIEQAVGMLKGDTSLTEALLEEHARERASGR